MRSDNKDTDQLRLCIGIGYNLVYVLVLIFVLLAPYVRFDIFN